MPAPGAPNKISFMEILEESKNSWLAQANGWTSVVPELYFFAGKDSMHKTNGGLHLTVKTVANAAYPRHVSAVNAIVIVVRQVCLWPHALFGLDGKYS